MEKAIKNKNFFVTGGAGFIGSNFADELAKRSANVFIYDNFSTGKMEHLNGILDMENVTLIKGDLKDYEKTLSSLKEHKIDVVVHLAANADIIKAQNDHNVYLDDVLATYNLLRGMEKLEIKDLLYTSTSAVYGNARITPTPEEYGYLAPVSLYGASKLSNEGIITTFSSNNDINYKIFRLANVVGKNYSHGVIINIINQLAKDKTKVYLLGDGNQRKSYMDVSDVVNSMLHIYQNVEKSDLYNISLDETTLLRDIANMIIENVAPGAGIVTAGTKIGHPGDITFTHITNQKMKKTGFYPKFSSREAIMRCIKHLTSDKSSSNP